MVRTLRSLFSFYLFIIIIILLLLLFCIFNSDFPLLASCVRVGRSCWVGQGPAVLAAGRRPTNLDNGRARAYLVCSTCEFFLSRLSFFFSFSRSLGCMDGWMTWDFTSYSIEFKLYQDDGWVVDDCVQWNHVYD